MEEISSQDLSLLSKFSVTSADTDNQARLRIGAFTNFLIQSAINSADRLGFGFGGLKQQNLYWVLARITLEINRPFNWRDIVEVETWPKDIDGILYLRDFLVRDAGKNVVAKATSGWLAIDNETKRPKKVDAIHAELFVHLRDKHALEQPPEKLAAMNDGDSFEVVSTFFDIDLNKHVTSTRYIDWILDSFPLDFHIKNYPKKISVNFMKETMLTDRIQFKRSAPADNEYCFEGTNQTHGFTAFRARIHF